MILLCNDLLLPRGIANVEEYLCKADQLINLSLTEYPEGKWILKPTLISGSLFHVMGSHCAQKQL